MNKDNAKEFLPIVKALSEGRTIEIKNTFDDNWSSAENISFSLPLDHYRIKPKIKKTEWVVIYPDLEGAKNYMVIRELKDYEAQKSSWFSQHPNHKIVNTFTLTEEIP